MTVPALTGDQRTRVDEMVAHFIAHQHLFTQTVTGLRSLFADDPNFPQLVHSMKWRVKDPEHLREKLSRPKYRAMLMELTPENLFEKINDLAGFRILHLHTTQMEEINRRMIDMLAEAQYEVVEGPTARTWDNEYKGFFEGLGISTVDSDSMYTSVHYIVRPTRRVRITAEIQVRTLAEELWGEVDHAINYPEPSPSAPCREQIKVLARLTSSCSRLVDSIFSTHKEVSSE